MTTETDLSKRLRELRARIDAVDGEIVRLLKERLDVALEIGRAKAEAGQDPLDPAREQEVIRNILSRNGGAFPAESLKAVFTEIISACRNAQRPERVGYLGPEGTFSHLAATRFFGHAPELLPVPEITEVFDGVARGRMDHGVVPIENSVEGSVAQTLDGLVEFDVKVCGEVFLPVSHALMNRSGRLEDIRRVLSHAQSLAQCRMWLRRNLPGIPVEAVGSTAQAAARAAEDPGAAAIAAPAAAERFGLRIVAEGIEDYAGNTTRFLVLGRNCPGPTGNDKTSLLLSLENRPGALYRTLKPLADRSINLTKIQSRPVKNEPWRYLFFVDLAGHLSDPDIRDGVAAVEEGCASLKWLGSYPAGEPLAA
ncbi:prephenate dehydratase [Dissulfurirhabdus thermomarina]|uniref:Bifunctional chorismate mutase/prephenate dehydratase n=1 Tax=Dissulfurirhabdus thermomarina TaxID=1765737 RepID=A0A6N9TLH5_DISTH|nr:prephenate dehydratase [Dissulfurirhabdus thermomarina]NDY41280.1 prephenate dehydratase [Dissulfurirhabdus thermomarina]NMX23737.1 prephenate dehydratase [Dissulfurirhabdus thermomarina]